MRPSVLVRVSGWSEGFTYPSLSPGAAISEFPVQLSTSSSVLCRQIVARYFQQTRQLWRHRSVFQCSLEKEQETTRVNTPHVNVLPLITADCQEVISFSEPPLSIWTFSTKIPWEVYDLLPLKILRWAWCMVQPLQLQQSWCTCCSVRNRLLNLQSFCFTLNLTAKICLRKERMIVKRKRQASFTVPGETFSARLDLVS